MGKMRNWGLNLCRVWTCVINRDNSSIWDDVGAILPLRKGVCDKLPSTCAVFVSMCLLSHLLSPLWVVCILVFVLLFSLMCISASWDQRKKIAQSIWKLKSPASIKYDFENHSILELELSRDVPVTQLVIQNRTHSQDSRLLVLPSPGSYCLPQDRPVSLEGSCWGKE